MNEELQGELLTDCRTLADECQGLVRSLERFAIPNEGVFILEQYRQFFRNRKVPDYLEITRNLANKIHGLKGVLGFLIPEAKQLCHLSEEVIKPLAQSRLVLDDRLHALLTRFIYEIQGMLETYTRTPTATFDLGDWPKRMEQGYEEAQTYIEQDAMAVAAFLVDRGKDDGTLRKRDTVTHLSVIREGYEELATPVHQLFEVISELSNGSALQHAGRLYNAFLDQHQRIKKLPLDVSRYERLVPSLAEKYGVRGRFVHEDAGVRADLEFWAAIHEISNHILKNAVIHGLESPLDRVKANKDEVGHISLIVREELLHIDIAMGDDGRGIDPQRIARKALEVGVVSQERLDQMSQEEVLGLVFEQGVSTMETLDDNAGRGIGMSAVREAMERHAGTCRIVSELGKGTSWQFRFPKTNVSLPCFVTRMGDYLLVVPEAHVRFFAQYTPELITSLQGRPMYRHMDLLVGMVDCKAVFGEHISADLNRKCQLMVVQDGGPPLGLLINEVLDKAILPIHPLTGAAGASSLFIGATLHDAQPVLVLAVNQLDTGT